MIHRYVLRDRNRRLSSARAHEIFLGPYVTEKTAQLAQAQRIVVKVSMDANKIDIKRAFETVFQVPVESVNTLITKPRTRHYKGKVATRAAIKKAIIKVKEGFDIEKVLGQGA